MKQMRMLVRLGCIIFYIKHYAVPFTAREKNIAKRRVAIAMTTNTERGNS
jgi:hypothetical protein